MPTLQINGCGDCPHCESRTCHNLEDMVDIKCGHPEADEDLDYFRAKIKNIHHSIYFDCPLEKRNADEVD